MTTVLLALGLIAGIGSILRYIIKDLDVDAARKTIGALVLNIFLPALVFRVIYTAEMGAEFYQIPLTILLSTIACLGIALLVFRAFRLRPEEQGALILASAFGNVTYLGLPVLQGLFPALTLQVAKVAILCEVTTTPLNLSLGMSLGKQFNRSSFDSKRSPDLSPLSSISPQWSPDRSPELSTVATPILTAPSDRRAPVLSTGVAVLEAPPLPIIAASAPSQPTKPQLTLKTCVQLLQQTLQQMLQLPALWAVAIAILWKVSGLAVPGFLLQSTQILGNTVTGLMMLSLGMGLRYRRIYQPLPLLMASGLKLLVSPLLVFGIASLIGIPGSKLVCV